MHTRQTWSWYENDFTARGYSHQVAEFASTIPACTRLYTCAPDSGIRCTRIVAIRIENISWAQRPDAQTCTVSGGPATIVYPIKLFRRQPCDRSPADVIAADAAGVARHELALHLRDQPPALLRAQHVCPVPGGFRKPPILSVKRPARPCNSGIQKINPIEYDKR
jgi:hypothetical protein